MKKILFVGAALFLLLSSCQTQLKEQNISSPSEIEQNDSPKIDETKYENDIYGFSIVFPSSWGEIQEFIADGPSGSKIHKTVRFTSENDSDRYLQIQVVKNEDKNDPSVIDYPHTALTSNAVYAFYYSGAGDYTGMPGEEDQKYFDIQRELEEIVKTFEAFK